MSDPRPHPPEAGDERSTLNGFLDFLRATVHMKVAGLTVEESRRPLLDSSPLMTPAGVVKHLTAVERWWFSLALADADLPFLFDKKDRDFEFRLTEQDSVDAVLERYAEECARSRDVAASMELGDVARRPGRDVTLRWVLTHMIEETARHAGHLDFLREAIDGQTGE